MSTCTWGWIKMWKKFTRFCAKAYIKIPLTSVVSLVDCIFSINSSKRLLFPLNNIFILEKSHENFLKHFSPQTKWTISNLNESKSTDFIKNNVIEHCFNVLNIVDVLYWNNLKVYRCFQCLHARYLLNTALKLLSSATVSHFPLRSHFI